MSASEPKLVGLVPDHLKVRSARILLESLAVQADIGFHEFEVGAPQRLLVTVEIWLEDVRRAAGRRSAARLELRLSARRGRRDCGGPPLQPAGDAGACRSSTASPPSAA